MQHERGGAERLHGGQALRASPGRRPGMARAPRARAPSKPAQKPTKSPNENGKKTRSPGPSPAPAQHEAPAARPPVPGLLRVEPAERRAAGARGLVHAHVALERVRQVGAERRMRGLVLDQLALRVSGSRAEVVPAAEIVGATRGRPRCHFARDERVGAGGSRAPAPGAGAHWCARSASGSSVSRRRSKNARHARSLKRWILPGGGLGQLGDELDPARVLVGRDLVLHEAP